MSPAVPSLVLLLLSSLVLAIFSARDVRILRRRFTRFLGLVFPLVIFPVWDIRVFRSSVFIPAIILGLLEFARFLPSGKKTLLERLISSIAKEGEEKHVSGLATYFWGASFASLAPDGIGPAVMAMATLADAWGAMAGSLWGRKRTPLGKSLPGTLACFISAFWMGLTFSTLSQSSRVSIVRIAVTSLIIAAAERYTPGRYDNMTSHAAGAVAMFFTRPPVLP
ncbi:MAG: hypothetical protein STSR0007_08570 [Thermovirga sp.]